MAHEERTLLARPLFPSPTASEADDIGHRLQELNVLVGETPPRARVRTEHAEWSCVALDQDTEAAQDTAFSEELRRPESRLRRKIANHDRLICLDGISRMGLTARAEGRATDQARWPTQPRAQQKRGPSGEELEHRTEFDS